MRKRKPEFKHLDNDDLKVLTLREAAALDGTAFVTFKRTIARGEGPRTIQLSPGRVGVRRIDYRKWQEARLRSA